MEYFFAIKRNELLIAQINLKIMLSESIQDCILYNPVYIKFYKCKLTYSDGNKISGCGGGSSKAKRDPGNFWEGYVHYLNYGDRFTSIYMSKLIVHSQFV